MINFRNCLIIVVTVMVLHSITMAESPDDGDDKTWGIAPVFVPFYSPETGFGGAASVLTYWNADRSAARPDTASMIGVYTEKNQFFVGLNSSKYLIGDQLLIKGKIGFNDWQNTFYGIGGKAPVDFNDDYEEEFYSQGYDLELGLAVRLHEGVYLGARWTFEDNDLTEFDKDGWLGTSGLTGVAGGVLTGPGLTFSMDSRDEAFFPTSGFLLEVEYNWFDESYGSDYDFELGKSDLRYYRSFKPKHILAWQLELEYSRGNIPFYRLPSLASRGNSMRGIEEGKEINATRFAFQTEYRFPVWRRFGGVVFGAIGNVADKLANLGDDTRFAGGVGVRYTVETNKNINIRFDLGIDDTGEVNVYFTVREAF